MWLVYIALCGVRAVPAILSPQSWGSSATLLQVRFTCRSPRVVRKEYGCFGLSDGRRADTSRLPRAAWRRELQRMTFLNRPEGECDISRNPSLSQTPIAQEGLDEQALVAAFAKMETLSVVLQDARKAGDRATFEAAAIELRLAQTRFLRDLNRFPAETARLLAERQNSIIDQVALDPVLDPVEEQDAGRSNRGPLSA